MHDKFSTQPLSLLYARKGGILCNIFHTSTLCNLLSQGLTVRPQYRLSMFVFWLVCHCSIFAILTSGCNLKEFQTWYHIWSQLKYQVGLVLASSDHLLLAEHFFGPGTKFGTSSENLLNYRLWV